MTWDKAEDNFVDALKNKGSEERLQELGEKLTDPNAHHIWKNADFSLLFHASLEDSLSGAKILIDKGADPTWVNSNGTNVLSLLMKRGQIEMANYCFDKVPKEKLSEVVTFASSSGWTPLMSAAENGKLDAVYWLLDHGADVNQQMSTGWTALHAAAKKGHKNVAAGLIERGADRNLVARHRDYGDNCKPEDVTTNSEILKVLK